MFDRFSNMQDFSKHSIIRERADCEFQEFCPSLSKPIIDMIDLKLSKVFSLTAVEEDYLANFDIKYRIGQRNDDGDD